MLTKHHRKCKSNGGGNERRNISRVSSKKHCAWHTLFENQTPEEIADTINAVWLDPDYEIIIRRRR